MSETLHGFFSKKDYDLFGGNYYLSDKGEEVLITAVYNRKDVSNNYRWDDVEYMGVVTKYLRSDGNDKNAYFKNYREFFDLVNSPFHKKHFGIKKRDL